LGLKGKNKTTAIPAVSGLGVIAEEEEHSDEEQEGESQAVRDRHVDIIRRHSAHVVFRRRGKMLFKREQTMRALFKANHPDLTDPMEVIEKYVAKRKLRLLDLFHQARRCS
jgi:hypothetical protein